MVLQSSPAENMDWDEATSLASTLRIGSLSLKT